MVYPFHEKTIMVRTAQGHYVGELRFYQGPNHSLGDCRAFVGKVVGVPQDDVRLQPGDSGLGDFFRARQVAATVKGL